MTEQNQDEHDYIEIDDLGDELRPAALAAWNVPESMMTHVDAVSDLPLAAALQGPQGSRRMFTPQADAYALSRAQETPLHCAVAAHAGIDLVRISVDAPFGRFVIVDTASFTVFSAPPDVPLAGGLLNNVEPPVFDGPDPQGWSTTAPDVWVQKMRDWHHRIDRHGKGTESFHLLYKTFPSSSVFTPSLKWF